MLKIDQFSYLILGAIFGFGVMFFLAFLHWKKFRKNLKVILMVNLITQAIWIPGDFVAYQQEIWAESPNKILGIRFWKITLEDIIFGIICATTISFVTILVNQYHQKGLRFRENFFKFDR